tara:strand:+ start:108 stop:1391 length:1284 start_codon:yes stop_codon:yes gene_type:complete
MWFFKRKKTNFKNSGKKWTEKEESILLEGISNEATSEEISKILHRDPSAISAKYNQINKKRRSGSWGEEETKILIALWNDGASLENIGAGLNRKRNSILGRLNSLSSWGYPGKIKPNLSIGKTSNDSEITFDMDEAILKFKNREFTSPSPLKLSDVDKNALIGVFGESGLLAKDYSMNMDKVKEYALKGYEVEHIAEQTKISTKNVEKIMDEINIWDEYDSIMLKKAENRWSRQPKKGNEKSIFEELLIKREREENKAKDYVRRLISSPEGTQTEFKETFWRCTRTKENNNKDVIHSSMKNINAFFNTKGGDLVIGVRDYDRDVVGINFDGYKDDETYVRRIRDRIKNSMKGKFSHLFTINIVEIKNQKLCLITAEASDEPIFLHDKKYKDRELFYVREGDSATLYDGRDLINYIQNTFNADNDKNA